MHKNDAVRLRHMLDAAREASGFVAGKVRADLDRDRMLALALLKELEIIGEAAGKVSEETRTACGEIPWANIVGMRNRLIHGYFGIDLDIVWQTAITDLVQLIPALERCLPSQEVG